ncbi:hypothetical protein GQ54DRAFT_312029 [Martensiomyces pterosporus]|nr:hypothetical protein GQ54DRAFT_312029 [Martensiomyces pterosporus]
MAGSGCRAQNILEACLVMQQRQFKGCEYDNWECKCSSQKKILTCYDNCPDSESRTIQEIQVQIFCGALNGREYNSELMDRMTRPAKIEADEQAPSVVPQSQAAAPPPPSQPKASKGSDTDGQGSDQWASDGGGGVGGRRNKAQGGGNISLVADSSAAETALVRGVPGAAALIAAVLVAAY